MRIQDGLAAAGLGIRRNAFAYPFKPSFQSHKETLLYAERRKIRRPKQCHWGDVAEEEHSSDGAKRSGFSKLLVKAQSTHPILIYTESLQLLHMCI